MWISNKQHIFYEYIPYYVWDVLIVEKSYSLLEIQM